MSGKNYDICKEINSYYFRIHPKLEMIFPRFFDIGTEEDDAVQKIGQLVNEKKYDEAVSYAEQCLERFPLYADAFLVWQIFTYWSQGKIPTSEFMNYFATMEEMNPDQAYINFDKALLHLNATEFNLAVEELKKARKKDPNHLPSLSLLFLIYYLSGDEQWRSLYATVQKGGFIDDKVMMLISIGEALKDKKPSPLYLPGDKDNIADSNRKLLEQFPPMVIARTPQQKNVIFIAVDASVYFRMFASTFMMSVEELQQNDFGVHVHLYDPLGVDLELMEKYAEKFAAAHISFSYEKAPLELSFDQRVYYASMRFCRAWELLENHENIEKLVVVDADALVRKSPFAIKGVQESDVTLTGGTQHGPFWDRIAAGFACFTRTENAREIFGYAANVILKNTTANKLFWFIDQIALFDSHQRYQSKAKIHIVSGDEVFGKNLEQKDGSFFWTYTNEEKGRENPMNIERRVLLNKYGIREDWNAMARGKYGNVIANVNDEYIGKALLTHGSWCDNEVAIMRQILDKGDTAIEVGSNMGSHTVALAKAVGNSGKLIAMEPQRIMFQTLCANIAVNSMRNVFTMNVACGEKEGILRVSELDPMEKQNFGGYQPKQNLGDVEVRVITIDSLNLTSCKLIKMDIEGMEIEAMKGAKETLTRLQPVLFFESHGAAVKEIATYLATLDYIVYDFAIPNDPMYLAVTKKHEAYPKLFGIRQVE